MHVHQQSMAVYTKLNLLNRTKIRTSNELKKNTNAHEDFFTLVVQCHILVSAMSLFGMNELDDYPCEDIVAEDIWTHERDERKRVLDSLCQHIIDEHVTFNFNKKERQVKDPVYRYAIEVLSMGLIYF